MQGSLKQVRRIAVSDGQRLYVEAYISGFPNTILFIHGGPGESCISFSYAAHLLAQRCNVIVLDQRGVMRSPAEVCREKLTVEQLILDFEDIRKHFQIEKWVLLGHSFGGYLAMRYAAAYPGYVQNVIYENPCFDITNSLEQLLMKFLDYYQREGMPESGDLMRALLGTNDIVAQLDGILSLPARERKAIYRSEAVTPLCRQYYCEEEIDNAAVERCKTHYDAIKRDSSLTRDYWEDIEGMGMPSLLLSGEYDPMLPGRDCARWLRNRINSRVVIPGAGHFIHSDTPGLYAQTIAAYLAGEGSL